MNSILKASSCLVILISIFSACGKNEKLSTVTVITGLENPGQIRNMMYGIVNQHQNFQLTSNSCLQSDILVGVKTGSDDLSIKANPLNLVTPVTVSGTALASSSNPALWISQNAQIDPIQFRVPAGLFEFGVIGSMVDPAAGNGAGGKCSPLAANNITPLANYSVIGHNQVMVTGDTTIPLNVWVLNGTATPSPTPGDGSCNSPMGGNDGGVSQACAAKNFSGVTCAGSECIASYRLRFEYVNNSTGSPTVKQWFPGTATTITLPSIKPVKAFLVNSSNADVSAITFDKSNMSNGTSTQTFPGYATTLTYKELAPNYYPTPAPTPHIQHIYVSDANFGIHVCDVNTTTGMGGSCINAPNGTGANEMDIRAVKNSDGSFTAQINAQTGIFSCSVSDPTGNLACVTNSNSLGSASKRLAIYTNPSGNSFAYTTEGSSFTLGVLDCPITNGIASGCAASNGSMSVPTAQLNAIAFFTDTASNVHAYAVDGYSTGTIYSCLVTPATGALTTCTPNNFGTLTLATPSYPHVFVQDFGATAFLYVTNYTSGTVSKCPINTATGTIGTCSANNGGISAATFYPWSVSVTNFGGSNYFAYIADQYSQIIYMCTVTPATGTFSGCVSSGITGITQPYGAVVF